MDFVDVVLFSLVVAFIHCWIQCGFFNSSGGSHIPSVVLMAAPFDLPAESQFTVQLWFQATPETTEWTLNQTLAAFQLDHLGCELNEYVMALSTGRQNFHLPAIEHVERFWTAWDEPITDRFCYHLLVVDRSLYQHMRSSINQRNMEIVLGGRLDRTDLHVHLLPATEMIEVVGRMHGAMTRMQGQLHSLDQECRATRRLLHQVLDILVAHHPQMTTDLNAILPPPP